MQGDMTIDVVLTKHDLREYYFAGSKKSFLVSALICVILIFALALTIDLGITFIIFEAVVLILALFLGFFTRYKAVMNELDYNRNYEKERQYRFSREGYGVQTVNGFMSMNWHDITRVVELRPCFLIVLSIGKIHLMPKRCFTGPEQLVAFYDLIESGVDRKKLRIKKFPFAGFSPEMPFRLQTPDYAVTAEGSKPVEVDASGSPLFRFSVQYNKKDLLSLNYWYYYTRPVGIIGTILGILMVLVIIMDLSLELDISIILPTILCLYFLIFSPMLVYFQTIKMFKQDAEVRNVSTYDFYNDHIVITNANGVYKKNIGNLRRIASTTSAYLFFTSKRMTYIIPKRYIEDKAAFEDYFRFIKAENRRLNSYIAMNPSATWQEPSRFCTNCGTARPSPEYFFCSECGKEYTNK